MNLRLPVIATVVAAAALVAATRALHHDATPFTGADIVAASPAPATLRGRGEVARDTARVTVYVAGDVARAGVYALPGGSRAVDALKAAGGASIGADLVAVNLAEPLTDGEEIVVPVKGAEAPDGATATAAQGRRTHAARRTKKRHRKHRSHHAASADPAAPVSADTGASTASVMPTSDAPTETIDLNSADENELETLPGIGAALAERIVAFRELNGPFGSPDDLLDVGGMTQGRLDAIAPYVTTR
jgi:competence protein ComEA